MFKQGYQCFHNPSIGDVCEVVTGHVNVDTFNYERSKEVEGDPLDADDIQHAYGCIDENGVLYWSMTPEKNWEPITVCRF
jgi:hypothetical protein